MRERSEVRYFEPLLVNRLLDIQPLLTPDRDEKGRHIFLAHAVEMINEAKDRVWVQNQSFAFLGNDSNDSEFEALFGALLRQQKAGRDVRVIFRDPNEFPNGDGKFQSLLERLKDFGLDTDKIKVQRKLHAKGIIIDEAQVMIGSHNLTNAGCLWNRDASLRVRDADVTRYFAEIFSYDWDVLATQEVEELAGEVRLASEHEATPPGYVRVSAAAFLAGE